MRDRLKYLSVRLGQYLVHGTPPENHTKAVCRAIRAAVAAIDPNLPVYALRTVAAQIDYSIYIDRMIAALSAFFGGLATLLAAIGLYGVMAFLVSQRTQEIGVRMALGATPGGIVKLVLRRASIWTLTGAALGLVATLFATRVIRPLLFDVPALDPWTLATIHSVRSSSCAIPP